METILKDQSTEEWLSHYNYRDMEIQLRENNLQTEQLNSAMDLFKALQWLAVACIGVKAWKCVNNAVTILIEPTEHAHESIIYGCTIVKAPANSNLLEK